MLSVTVVNDVSAGSVIDSRRYEDEVLPCLAHRLPDKLEELCRLLVRSYGLRYGALDFVVDKYGQYWFLELNPTGEFGYYLDAAGYNPVECIVDLLVGKGKE